MHLQDGPDVDLPVQVARAVKEKTRPWWSITMRCGSPVLLRMDESIGSSDFM